MTDATRRAAVAERAARAGGAVAREQFRTDVAVEAKRDANDPVTATDREAQERVVATIRRAFPDDAFVCEEDERGSAGGVDRRESVPAAGDAWVVDPIDGTANFVRGMRFWATSVAAVVDDAPVGAATYLPVEGDVYAAGPESVTHDGSSMSVSDRSDPGTFAVGLVGRLSASSAGRYTALFRAAAERFGDVRRLGCMQGVLALVAAGSLDAAFMPGRPHPWDAVAGAYLVRRAGGRVTDADGDRWHHASENLVVSNGRAHDSVLEAVGEGLAAGRTDRD